MAHKSGEGHIPSSLSILDIVWVLYARVLQFEPSNPLFPRRDRFFLSKGHASLALYVVLAKVGFFPKSELDHFAEYESILGGHPDRLKAPGVEASTGSLGHGFPQAVGAALALKIKGESARVFVLIGDGETNEGTIWESALLASHHKLHNLVCILDFNHSTDRALEIGDMNSKFSSFGWDVREIDGHDHNQIKAATLKGSSDQPLLIVAHTTKGKGFKAMENNPEWHHKIPTESDLLKFLDEIA
jgi:transketolase